MIFGTVEISDPRFEGEGLREMTVRSPALGRRADLTVWVSERLEYSSEKQAIKKSPFLISFRK